MIFSKRIVVKLEFDSEKMPLGKLSQEQIQKAHQVLTRLQNSLTERKSVFSMKSVISCTNEFYSLIPQNFGNENPPLLKTLRAIEQKLELLDSLMEIERGYSLLLESKLNLYENSIDSLYKELKADIRPIVRSDPIFDIIVTCVRNTHSTYHDRYKLQVEEIFEVMRQGEEERFTPIENYFNRRLLWHGSKLIHFPGILSRGLLINPPESSLRISSTNNYYGKGIYFTDMVSKAANYTRSCTYNGTGLLLLCEVALGRMKRLFRSRRAESSPPMGYHSIKGIGERTTDPHDMKVLDNGAMIALGRDIRTPWLDGRDTSLVHNDLNVSTGKELEMITLSYLLCQTLCCDGAKLATQLRQISISCIFSYRLGTRTIEELMGWLKLYTDVGIRCPAVPI